MEYNIFDEDGAKINYEIDGEGDPLIFLHAGGLDCRMWDLQFRKFANHFKVIRYNFRGTGHSSHPRKPFSHHKDLHEFIDFLGIENPILIGASLGGKVAIDFALSYPKEVKALILESPGLGGLDFSQQYIQTIVPIIGALKTNELHSKDFAFFKNSFLALSTEDDAIIHKITDMLQENAQFLTINPGIIQGLEPPANQQLSKIKIPVLLIQGEKDHRDLFEIAEIIKNKLPLSQQKIIADTGHLPNLENPTRFNQVLNKFLLENQ